MEAVDLESTEMEHAESERIFWTNSFMDSVVLDSF